MSAVLILARLTCLEAVRRRIVLAAGLMAVAFLALYHAGFYYVIVREVQAHTFSPLAVREASNFLLLAGMYAVNFLGVLMAALLGADTLAGEIASETVQALVTKPIPRSAIVAGKWVGLSVLIGSYLALLAGGIVLGVWLRVGTLPHHLAAGLALLYLEAILVMTVTLAGSSATSTLATGGIAFGLYGVGFVGGWIEHVGAFLKSETAVNVGVISSLVFPGEALWKRASYELSSPIVRAAGLSPWASPSVPSAAMIAYAVLYLVAALGFALRRFGRRDL